MGMGGKIYPPSKIPAGIPVPTIRGDRDGEELPGPAGSRWDPVDIPTRKSDKAGELGVKQLKAWNNKQSWQLCTLSNVLWQAWCDSKLEGASFWSVKISVDCAWAWRKASTTQTFGAESNPDGDWRLEAGFAVLSYDC
ncbi:hypothetical protein SLEP1_g44731 [Rubroshorea leprosula]|uniref:Uncharacterized protein n=1 Tax=Rubroshorea leprosula TaxID=152421 RepID=A0AAV5LH15_9ROSI|nr:hypothetical protein SLEP1_g44731 [Rubroshorea leprosula]